MPNTRRSSAGEPGVAPGAHADILTPTWRRIEPAAVDADDDTAVAGGSDTDTDDEAYVQRHEELAVEERRRWAGPVSVSEPGTRRSRVSGAAKPVVPLFPTPLQCFELVESARRLHAEEAGPLIVQRRAVRKRRRALAAVSAPLHAFAATEGALAREKTKLRRAINKMKGVYRGAAKNRVAKARAAAAEAAAAELAARVTSPGASPLPASPDVDPSPSPSPSPQASIRAPTPALPSPPPPGSAALETSPTAASVAAPDEVKTPVSAAATPMAPSLPALPFLSHLGSDKGAAIVHASPPTPASGLGQPAMSPTLATSALPTPAASPSPSPRATPAPESLGTIIADRALSDLEEIEVLFRSKTKPLLQTFRNLATQAECNISRPVSFNNLQKDITLARKAEEESEANASMQELDEDTVSAYIQRKIDANTYPALAKSFRLPRDYRWEGLEPDASSAENVPKEEPVDDARPSPSPAPDDEALSLDGFKLDLTHLRKSGPGTQATTPRVHDALIEMSDIAGSGAAPQATDNSTAPGSSPMPETPMLALPNVSAVLPVSEFPAAKCTQQLSKEKKVRKTPAKAPPPSLLAQEDSVLSNPSTPSSLRRAAADSAVHPSDQQSADTSGKDVTQSIAVTDDPETGGTAGTAMDTDD